MKEAPNGFLLKETLIIMDNIGKYICKLKISIDRLSCEFTRYR